MELFLAWLSAKPDIEIQLNFAYRIGPLRLVQKYPRDSILQFSFWSVKANIIAAYREQP